MGGPWSESSAVALAALAAAAPSAVRARLAGGLGAASGAGPVGSSRVSLSLRVFGLALVLQALRRYWLSLWHGGARGALAAVLRRAVAVAIALPGVRGVVSRQVRKELASIERKMHGEGDPGARERLPREGLAAADILKLVGDLQAKEREATSRLEGRQWGGIYHSPRGPLVELQNAVWGMYNSTNTLYEGVFPSVRKFEAELISWVLHLVHGDPGAGGGVLTSGGTESVLLAALAYREVGRRRGVSRPRVLAASTCHPAIDKACHYFGMELTKLWVGASTGFALSARAVRPHLTGDVVCIYASAPTFPHGVIDHIEDLATLAGPRGIGLHVDNCLGGVLLSHADAQGLVEPHQPWDLRVPGVSSISVDIHKYGCSSKGVSVVAFRDAALRRLTYVPVTDGCEGLYVTPTLQGARGGAVIAQAWATMMHLGERGYLELSRAIQDLHQKYQEAVRRVPGLRVLCECHACIVPIASDRHSIYAIASLMEDRGWNLFTGQSPPVLSICIGELHGELLELFEHDLCEAVRFMDENPGHRPTGTAAVYGATATTPTVILEEVVRQYVDLKLSVRAAH